MTKFIIRSMTTTDFRVASHGRPGQQPKPYHVYLLKAERRARAYWSSKCADTQLFDTVEAAQAEIDRCLPRKASYEPLYDIVPKDDSLVPTFWDTRRASGNNARIINDQTVVEA